MRPTHLYHPWSGAYSMRLSNLGFAWFTSKDPKKPNFFLESSAFSPNLCDFFKNDIQYDIEIQFRHDEGALLRVDFIRYRTDTFIYPRHLDREIQVTYLVPESAQPQLSE